MMTRYPVSLVHKDPCGSEVATFTFTRPEGYEFRAGQFFRLTLDTEAGEETKTFSHVAAPADPELMMTTRLSGSTFKSALASLEVGATVLLSAPGGRLHLPVEATRFVFLVGGVGITPVRSMLRDASLSGRAFDDALLLYGNRDESCAPFLDEFEAMHGSGCRVVPVYERPADSWSGERGFISAETVRRHVDPDAGHLFVVTGPPPMVAAMERVMDELGIDEGRRIVERFTAPA